MNRPDTDRLPEMQMPIIRRVGLISVFRKGETEVFDLFYNFNTKNFMRWNYRAGCHSVFDPSLYEQLQILEQSNNPKLQSALIELAKWVK